MKYLYSPTAGKDRFDKAAIAAARYTEILGVCHANYARKTLRRYSNEPSVEALSRRIISLFG